MADLKKDLLNELVNRKYYSEIELIRLAQEPNMNYKKKIEEMVVVLQDIALLNSQINLMGQYFQEPQQQNVGVQNQQQVVPQNGHVHPGQTHGE